MIIIKWKYQTVIVTPKIKKNKQLLPFIPKDSFRMLICGNSGSGKTNLLYHMLIEPLLYFDEIHLYAKMNEMSRTVGYDIMNVSNDRIIPINDIDYKDNLKLVIFDDYVCERNQRQILDYFIQGRHKNCSVIYLCQNFYKTPRDIRLNCSHHCIYEFPSSRESNMISSELGVNKENLKKQQKNTVLFCLLINQIKKKNFYGNI